MFNRLKDSAAGGPAQTKLPAVAAGSLTSTEANPASSLPAQTGAKAAENNLDDLLRRLEQATHTDHDSGSGSLKRIADEASDHAEALHTTASAQKEAERMLVQATKERDKLAARSAQVLLKAKEAAARLQAEAEDQSELARQETQEWVAEQRDAVEAVVAEVTKVANRDAEKIRSDAKATAMAEASRVAQKYVTRAVAIGNRDAEQIRSEARDVLGRSVGAVTQAHGTMQQFADGLAGFLSTIGEHLELMDSVLADATAGLATAEAMPKISVDVEFEGLAESLDDSDTLTAGRGEDAADSAVADNATELARPLGSMFRSQDNS